MALHLMREPDGQDIVAELRRVARAGEAAASLLLDGGSSTSRAEVLHLAGELAEMLRAAGCGGQGGDGRPPVVGLAMPASAAWVVAAVGALMAGCAPPPFPPRALIRRRRSPSLLFRTK